MSGRLTGKRVTALRRRSKYILCDLNSGETEGSVRVRGGTLAWRYEDGAVYIDRG